MLRWRPKLRFPKWGACDMGKIKAWTPNIYPHLVKTMDRHYSAGGIASDAQRYLDRGIKTDITTAAETTALMASQPTHSDKPRWKWQDTSRTYSYSCWIWTSNCDKPTGGNPSIVDWKSRTAPTYNMKPQPGTKKRWPTQPTSNVQKFLRGPRCFKGKVPIFSRPLRLPIAHSKRDWPV